MIRRFGTLPDGREVASVDLVSEGLRARILTYGASVQDLRFDGAPMVLGSNDLRDYLGPLQYSGAIVGRVANRISGARYEQAGVIHMLDVNEPPDTTLHGGADGTSAQMWQIEDSGADHVALSCVLPDGHMGFVGALRISARYQLDGATLRVELTAQSDQDTLCNLAPHCYFNLAGEGTIDGHRLEVAADHVLPLTDRNCPTGAVQNVAGTRFDFRKGPEVTDRDIDHNLCLSETPLPLRRVAGLVHPATARQMDVHCTAPGLQIYNAAHFSAEGITGHDGARYGPRAGLALEPQHWPDAAAHDHFPSISLAAGARYTSVSEFRFAAISADMNSVL